MEALDLARFVFAFLFVIALIGLCGILLKRYGKSQKIFGAQEGGGRIGVIETRYLDPRRKLMLIRRDKVEHLILLADGREVVIESNITPSDTPHA